MKLNVLYEYEAVLLGKKTGVSIYFFMQSPEQNEKTALTVIRYAVEKFLKWSPFDMYRNFNEDIIKRMRLESVMRYIQFPPEADEKTDLFIISNKLYPNQIKIDTAKLTLIMYKKVLCGKMYKFPKGFFDGSLGRYRAIVCFQYMLRQYCVFSDGQDMYRIFSMPKGGNIIKKYKLQTARLLLYDYNIDYLHDALPDENKSELFYHYYKFSVINEKDKKHQTEDVNDIEECE